LSHFSFNIKENLFILKPIPFATWLFILKPFSKTNKKHKQIKRQFLPPNYEVLIPHGYVGKGPCPSKSIKNVDK